MARWRVLGVAVCLLLAGNSRAPGDAGASALKWVPHTTASAYQETHPDDDLRAWRRRVPQTRVIRIPSTIDGSRQRAIFYDSGAAQPRPLLVALHSWSADYQQNLNIPFAEFAIANDWVFLHPNFRGPNRRPQATASDLAVQDVIDAVAYARRRAAVDPDRIYLVGYSGGAMKALVLAGRRPDLWAAVAAWGSIHDIPDWYHHNRGKQSHYRREIAASCGGPPRPGSTAEADCRDRSPLTHLPRAAGRVPVLIAHGLRDETVPPRHALLAYDALAAPGHRFTAAERAAIDTHGRVPPQLTGRDHRARSLLDTPEKPVRLERRSRTVTLVLFEGGHDMHYNATLRWLSTHRRGGLAGS